MQSPIKVDFDIVPNEESGLNVKFEYKNLKNLDINYVEDLTLLQLPYDEGYMHFKDASGTTHHYRTTHVEFHTPAEHILEGVKADLEMQIHHEKKDSEQNAVVSVLFVIVEEYSPKDDKKKEEKKDVGTVKKETPKRRLQQVRDAAFDINPVITSNMGGSLPDGARIVNSRVTPINTPIVPQQQRTYQRPPVVGYEFTPRQYAPVQRPTEYQTVWVETDGLTELEHSIPRKEVKFDGYFEKMRFSNNQETVEELRLADILDEAGEYFFNYGGSLTTPPCDEDVNWIIMASFLPLKVSEHKQFYAISTQYNRGNNRAIQNDNKRSVLLGKRETNKKAGPKSFEMLMSPTLNALRDEEFLVHIVQFIGREGKANSPSDSETKERLQKLASDPRVVVHKEPIDAENPLESDLLDYIELEEEDTPATMVWYQGKGAWANGPDMLDTVEQLAKYALNP